MDDPNTAPTPSRNLWLRALQMLVLLIALYVAGWLVCILSVVQLFAAAINGDALPQLRNFGSALGAYIRQIAAFNTFASDDLPFPFSDWPATQ